MAEEGIKVRFTGDASGVETAAKRGSAALKNFSHASGQATTTLTNFSRVVQDAPFGIMGIANNIDPLIASFQSLKAQTGSAGGAMKALLGTLAGPAGLALGVSVVTSLLITFGDRLFNTGKKAEEAKEKIKGLADLQREVNNEIAKEVSQVQLLKTVLESEVTSRKEKEAALKRLKQINPDYFGDLKIEGGLVDGLTASYQKYINSIQARSEVKVLEKQLDQLNETILGLQSSGNKGLTTRLLADAQQFLKTQGATAQAAKLSADVTKQEAKDQKNLNDALSVRQSLLDQLAIRAKDINVSGVDTKDIKIKDPVKVDELLLKPSTIGLDLSQTLKPEVAQLTRFELSDIIDTSKLTAPTSATIALPGVDLEKINATKEALKGLSEFAAEVGTAITVNLGGAFAGLFENILSGAQSAFQAFAQAIGNIIKKLIAAAAASALLSAILGPLGFVKDAGGNVLKGFSAFKSIFSKIGGFESGGIAQGPQSGYLTMLHGKEVVAPYKDFMSLMQGGNMGGSERLVAKISGSDLLFVLNRAQRNRGIIS
jgi:hypothetical protein